MGSFKSTVDTVFVKDSADVVIEFKSTHRGPLISEIHSYIDRYPMSIKMMLPYQ